MTAYPELFSPLSIGSLELRNRVVVPPMVQLRSITSADGLGWYRRLAGGGAGLVIVEATGVPRFGDDLTVESLRPLVEAVHGEGAAIAIQLFPILFGTDADVNDLSAEQIDGIVAQYGRAAEICRDAGFDGIEPHGAHGFLINRFFMPDQNQRNDDYGGSLENRCRLGVQIVERIRQAVGDGLLIVYRHTPVGEQYGVDDSLELARRLVAAGLDVLDVSPAMAENVADLAAPFAEALDVPVIAVNGMDDPTAACGAIRDGLCSLVAVGRQMIADARWPDKVRTGRDDEILACTECNGCFDDLEAGQPVTCNLWDGDDVAAYVR
ncbi:MAG: oxidoreductase [Planctomycetota bacterium]